MLSKFVKKVKKSFGEVDYHQHEYSRNDVKQSLLGNEEQQSTQLNDIWTSSHFGSVEGINESEIATQILSNSSWKETNFKTYKSEPLYDKVFCCEWIDNDNILYGTKDNKLLLLNTANATNQPKQIKLPISLKNKAINLDNIPNPGVDHEFNDIVSIFDHVHNPNDWQSQFNNKLRKQRNNNGMHAMSMNDDGTYVVTGGSNDKDISLFSIDKHSDSNIILKPLTILQNHNSWISSLKWLNYDKFISSSYDGTISIWSLSDILDKYKQDSHINVSKKYKMKGVDTLKLQNNSINKANTFIRDMDIHKFNKCVITLSNNGNCNIFDTSNHKLMSNIKLKYKQQCVTLKSNDNNGLISVGSFKYLQLFDPRIYNNSNENYKDFILKESLDSNLGIRSLDWVSNNILSISGGLNRLYFYDIRMNAYINELYEEKENNLNSQNMVYVTNRGHFRKDALLQKCVNSNSKLPCLESLFTHKFNPAKDKLFLGGGPTHAKFFGNKVSVLRKL